MQECVTDLLSKDTVSAMMATSLAPGTRAAASGTSVLFTRAPSLAHLIDARKSVFTFRNFSHTSGNFSTKIRENSAAIQEGTRTFAAIINELLGSDAHLTVLSTNYGTDRQARRR